MGPLPLSSVGNCCTVVITDLFSKWVEAFPVKSTDTETLVTFLIGYIFAGLECPITFIVTKRQTLSVT